MDDNMAIENLKTRWKNNQDKRADLLDITKDTFHFVINFDNKYHYMIGINQSTQFLHPNIAYYKLPFFLFNEGNLEIKYVIENITK